LAAAILGWPEGTHREIWDGVCVFLVFPAVVYAGTLVEPPPWLRPVATGLGLTSYAVYALHAPLLSVVDSGLRRLYHGDTSRGAPYVGIVVLVALLFGCWLVDRYYDSPIRRMLSARQRRPAATG
jgi:peptidoglycan/LPS O-acetylase OafA/YrhL